MSNENICWIGRTGVRKPSKPERAERAKTERARRRPSTTTTTTTMGGTGKTTHEDSITFTEDEDPWWRKVFCWVKAKHNKAVSARGSLLETQQQDEHGAPEGNQLRTQNSGLSDVSSLGTPGSGRSTSRLTMRSLHKIKEEMSLKKSYDVKFSFKRGYEAEFKTVRMLGRGAFGSVFLAMRRVPLDPAEPEVFAVKRIKKDMLKSKRHGHALLLEIGELLPWVCVGGSSNPRTRPDSLPPSLPPSSQRS